MIVLIAVMVGVLGGYAIGLILGFLTVKGLS